MKNPLGNKVAAACAVGFTAVLLACAPLQAPSAAKPAAPAPAQTAKPAAPTAAARPAATPAVGAEAPRSGGILLTTNSLGSVHLDLHQRTDWYTLATVAPAYNGLLQYDPLENQKVIPDLAKSWDVSPDGVTYTFNLRDDAKWHDGKPFTAADAKWNLDRILRPPSGVVSMRKGDFPAVASWEATGEHTLKVALRYPSASFVPLLAQGWMLMLPRHVVEKEGQDYVKRNVIGTGPFKLKTYTAGVGAQLVKNDNYHIKGRPYLDGISLYTILDLTAQFAAFRVRRIHLTPSTQPITATQAKYIRENVPDAVVQDQNPLSAYVLEFNTRRQPWSDVRVRRAANLAIDHQMVKRMVFEGSAGIGGIMPWGSKWSLPEAELLKMPGIRVPTDADIAEAKDLLAKSGFPGFKGTLMGSTGGFYPAYTEVVQSNLRRIGIDLTIELIDKTMTVDRQVKGEFEVVAGASTVSIDDPDTVFGGGWITSAPRNYSGYTPPKLDELYDQQSRTLDEAKRKEIVFEMQRVSFEWLPRVVVSYPLRQVAFWREVRGFQAGYGMYNNAKQENTWLAK
ncbi:MAG: ABC transporter substrate-binding protein [Chloroflexi bacterium]|nr:ABC transporter substrate-binding protein [Chloroflexota bacterium]